MEIKCGKEQKLMGNNSGSEKTPWSLKWKVLAVGDIEPEDATSYSQEGLSVAGGETTRKTFNPKCVLSKRSAGIKMERRLREWRGWRTNDWPKLRPSHGREKTPIINGILLCLQTEA